MQKDSLNLNIRKIRLNQVGYLPQDPNKSAFIADPSEPFFTVLKADDGKTVLKGDLKDVGIRTEGELEIHVFYNSTAPLEQLHRPAATVHLYRVDFSALKEPGTYYLKCGPDTSAHFEIDPKVYNAVFETTLKFFGVQRCGKTDSWIHGDCHIKDGGFLGEKYTGALAGGWHDCGDHWKVGETLGYTAAMLAMTYAFWPEKGEDFYGKSYHDTLPHGTDGIPDVLYEAKMGVDFILKLYQSSKELGLLDKKDMYHSIMDLSDHAYWDVPEKQEAQPRTKGGPPRTVITGIGSNVAGMYAAALAFFAWGWEPFDPEYAKTCLLAATDIYDKIVMGRRGSHTLYMSGTDNLDGFYSGKGETNDDEALAALALWYATKDPRFRRDLLEDPAQGKYDLAMHNQGTFPTGILAHRDNVPFGGSGWPSDYQNTFIYVLYGMAKLILDKPGTAAAYGISATTADSLKKDCLAAMKNRIRTNSSKAGENGIKGDINANEPYHDMFKFDWGFNRYNMGIVLELFLYWDLTKDPAYLNIGMDNLNYNLGMNPWDLSFIMGAGEKNLQHPHNRAANPDGYNAGGFPYKYRTPIGAFMGGADPKMRLLEDFNDYTSTETCIDFSAQLLMPTQILAQDLPIDTEGPKFRNVNIFPEERSAIVTWSTDEISRDTLYLLDAPGGKILQIVPGTALARNKQVEISNLTPGTVYYIYFTGMDVRRNRTVDNNNGEYWKFQTKASSVKAIISDVRVCNETHESALVTWWTKNGYYPSRVDYGKTKALDLSQSPDDAGFPTMFHRVTLKELETATTYFFQAVSDSAIDDNGGKLHQFSTTQVLVDYTVRIKPTSKAKEGGTHFYIDVANNESKPYFGLEIRFYFTADAATANGLIAEGFDNQIFDVSGMAHTMHINPARIDSAIVFGAPRQVPDMPDQWYFPITLLDTLPVAGRARFELQISKKGPNNNPSALPFSFFDKAWSVRPHTRPADPADFLGVDLSKGANGIYTNAEMVVTVNGKNELSYTETPYITAYYKGVHVYGYGPDYRTTDKLVVNRTATLTLTKPVAIPADRRTDRLDLRQEDGNILLAGTASSDPDGRIDEIVVNGETLPENQLTRTGGSVAFARPVSLTEGTNVFDVIAWDTANCAVESRKLIVNWRKAPPLPPPQAAKPEANPPSQAGTDSIVVALTSATPGASIWYTLDGSIPVPGSAASKLYSGVIVIRNQTTLKAIAVKAEFSPSDLMSEPYNVFPFKVANVHSAVLGDRDANGYADELTFSLDTSLGAPDLSVITAQLKGAKLTSGLILGGITLSGDVLRVEIAGNAVWIQDSKEKITVPATPFQEGMLRPGDILLRDGIAPVLRRALLRKGKDGSPDTLVTAFSEEVRIENAGARPFKAIRTADSMAYVFDLSAGVKTGLPSLKEGETAYRFIVTATPMAANAAVNAVPQSGDWVWIDPAAGLADLSGNAQSNPANIRVPLQIRVSLVQSVRIIADPQGISRIGHVIPGRSWTVYGGPRIQGTVGEGSASLPVSTGIPDMARSAGIMVETTIPFAISMRIHSNLGQFVSKVDLKVSERDFALLEPGTATGSRRLHLLWNGVTRDGNLAGTGAYVFMWDILYFPVDEPARGTTGKRRVGLLRNP